MPATLKRLLDHEVLTREQMIELGRRVQRGRSVVGGVVQFSSDAEAAVNSLVTGNMRFIAKTVAEVGGQRHFEDLVSAAVLYARRAAFAWDPAKCDSFLALLRPQVKAAVFAYLREFSSGATSMSAYQQQWLRKVRAERERLAEKLSRDPTQTEVINGSDLPPEKVVEFWHGPGVVELDAPRPTGQSDHGATEGVFSPGDRDQLSDSDPVRAHFETADNLQEGREMLRVLGRREARVISLLYGFAPFRKDGAAEPTLAAVGKEFGLTRERIRQIQTGALRKMRAYASQRQRAEAGDESASQGVDLRVTLLR